MSYVANKLRQKNMKKIWEDRNTGKMGTGVRCMVFTNLIKVLFVFIS